MNQWLFSFTFGVCVLGCSGQAIDGGSTAAAPDGGGAAPEADSAVGAAEDAGIGVLGMPHAKCVPIGGVGGGDQTCNPDPSVSTINGRCDEGQCRCEAGAQLVIGGKCARVKGRGLGGSCQLDDECSEGLRCLPIFSHPTPDSCQEVSRICTLGCKQGSATCEEAFGPAAHCFSGCSVGQDACALLAAKK